MFQRYITTHNPVVTVDPGTLQSISGNDAGSVALSASRLRVLNAASVHSGEAAFWIDNLSGTCVLGSALAIVIRADDYSDNMQYFNNVVFSAACSGDYPSTLTLYPYLFRYEMASSSSLLHDIPFSDSGLTWYDTSPSILTPGSVSFTDACSFVPYPELADDNSVYFGVALFISGPAAVTFAPKLHFSLRANFAEVVPYQPLRS